jgi:hypothetical protein
VCQRPRNDSRIATKEKQSALNGPRAIRKADLYAGSRLRLIDCETSVDALPFPRARRRRRRSCRSRAADQRRALRDRKSARHPVSQPRRGSGRRGLGDDAAESVAGTREAPSRRGDVVLVRAPRDAQLYRLSGQDVEDRRRGTTASTFSVLVSAERRECFKYFVLPGIDLGQDLCLGRIVVSSQLAVLHAKSVAPKSEMSNRGLLSCARG